MYVCCFVGICVCTSVRMLFGICAMSKIIWKGAKYILERHKMCCEMISSVGGVVPFYIHVHDE